MPYLNWKTAPIQQDVQPHSKREFQLTLRFSPSQRDELVAKLDEIFTDAAATIGAELRVDLPHEWATFWKLREGESRFLIAHPEQTQWVSTLALEASDGTKIVRAIRELSSGSSLVLSKLVSIGKVSNVEVILELKG